MSIKQDNLETSLFAASCFWGVEVIFFRMPGVVDACVGYCGGHVSEPSCMGMTGHAESIEVRFDPVKVGYRALLDVFWNSHDPTQLNRHGPDIGSQYRSVFFAIYEAQKEAALVSRDAHQQHLGVPVVTEIAAASPFYPAEEYHQRYLENLEKRGSNSL